MIDSPPPQLLLARGMMACWPKPALGRSHSSPSLRADHAAVSWLSLGIVMFRRLLFIAVSVSKCQMATKAVLKAIFVPQNGFPTDFLMDPLLGAKQSLQVNLCEAVRPSVPFLGPATPCSVFVPRRAFSRNPSWDSKLGLHSY